MKDYEKTIRGLGGINQWPAGYAMTLGYQLGGSWVVRCCAGHETPEEAKQHGLARLVDVASAVADRDVAAWVSDEVA